MNQKLLLSSILILALFGCSSQQTVSTFSTPSKSVNAALAEANYRVKRIADGDTITVTDSRGTDTRVRFACIDAPEVPHTKTERSSYDPADLDQFKWGRLARNRLTQLINSSGERVSLQVVDTDRYGRSVAEIRLTNGALVQQVLAREGLAVVYEQYIKNCPDAAVVEQAQADAKQQKIGVWSDLNFVMPWEWRHQNK